MRTFLWVAFFLACVSLSYARHTNESGALSNAQLSHSTADIQEIEDNRQFYFPLRFTVTGWTLMGGVRYIPSRKWAYTLYVGAYYTENTGQVYFVTEWSAAYIFLRGPRLNLSLGAGMRTFIDNTSRPSLILKLETRYRGVFLDLGAEFPLGDTPIDFKPLVGIGIRI